MKKSTIFIIFIILSTILIAENLYSQTIRTVGGAGANYANLKAAFDAINNGSLTGNIILQLTGSTTETNAITLNASGSGGANYSSITIYPTVSNVIISGDLNTNLIYLNGADNVTFDGRINQSGSEKSLTIQNTSTGASATTFRLINSAENNTIKYCIIKGSGTNSSLGIITISTANTGNGNDNNTITYNDITSSSAGRPRYAIFSAGTAERDNDNNIISYNNIYDCFNTGGHSYAIFISSYSNNYTISNNSIYETTNFAPSGSYNYNGIRVSTNSNHTVISNYVGGTQPNCGGSAMIFNANYPHYFCGIFISGGSTGASLVQYNIIKNINYTSTQANPFDGIFINSGNVNVYNNTIGSTSENNSIVINTPCASASATITNGVVTSITLIGGGSGYTTAPVITFSGTCTDSAKAVANISNGVVTSITLLSGGSGYTSTPFVLFDGATYSTTHGIIQNSGGTVNINNNNISGITTVGSTYYSHGFEGIYVRSGGGITNITNNLIGSLNTTNSIYVSSTAQNSLQKQDIYGIYSASTNTTTISGNTIANLTNNYSGNSAAARARGIQTSAGINTITNNLVRDIRTSSGQTSIKSAASLIGISQTINSGTQTVTGNTVYNLYNLNTTARYDIYGIYFIAPNSGVNTVANNFIHSIYPSSSNTGTEIEGIFLNGGSIYCYNNIISLGNSISRGYEINGIWDENGSGSSSYIYFNTVYIGGTVTSGTTSYTACIWSNNSGTIRNFRNNIFANSRTGGSSGYHLSIYLNNITNLTIDYNDYYNAAGTLGRIGANPRNNLSTWRNGTGQDNNSTDINPSFANPTGTTPDDFLASASLPAVTGTGITTDYKGNARAPVPQMGALESTIEYVWQGNTSSNFGTASNWTNNMVPPDGANIRFATSPANDCVLDQNRVLGKITNSQSAKKLVVNGKQLTITKELDFTNNAQIDATASNSTVVFGGTSTQVIPSGAFTNNTLNNLTINNNYGVAINNSLTINQMLILTSGNLSIGSNTLTLNGIVSVFNGGFTGGNNSNIIFSGSGTAYLPSVTLNNLTINRTDGVIMIGNVTVNGTLTLTNGTLTVGNNNTLTINSISVSNGKINANGDSATVVFNNSSAITLPNEFFTSSSIFNLTINGSGGITYQGYLTVNGILNLAANNPSSTQGILHMHNGSLSTTLTMGANAVTLGVGDVTGIVKRNYFIANKEYTFGNQFTKICFLPGGTYPDSIVVKILIGNPPIWKSNAIKRMYDFVQRGGSNCIATITTHYLDDELNGNPEQDLVQWTCYADSVPPKVYEWGRSNLNTENNWIEIDNINIGYFPTRFGQLENTLAKSSLSYYTWKGTQSTNWNTPENWDPVGRPNETSNIIIPDAANTNYDPVIPNGTEIKTITLQSGSILNTEANAQITINGGLGAWVNLGGTFNPSTSNLIFTNRNATMSGENDVYNLTIGSGDTLWMAENSVIRIYGSVYNNGVWRTVISGHTTVEYCGGTQTVVVPNPSTNRYSHLILSGSGTKTLPSSALNIYCDLVITGTTTVNTNSSLTIGGDLIVDEGATFNAGNFNHTIFGNFQNYGTVNLPAGYTITMKSDTARYIDGISPINFANLTLDNAVNVTIYGDVYINNQLTISRGYLYLGVPSDKNENPLLRNNKYLVMNPLSASLNVYLKLKGGISTTSNSKINATSKYSTIEFNGSSTQIIPDGLFIDNEVNNLKINNSSGVNMEGNLKINGELILNSGILNTQSNSIIFDVDAIDPVETSSSRIVGTAKILNVPVGTGSFSFLSMDISNGMDDLGNVSITRKTGPSAVIIVGQYSSIASHWKVESDYPPTNGRTITYKWLSVLDNGKNFSAINKAQTWYSTDDGNSWVAYGDEIDVSNSNPRIMNVTTTHFSYWVASDKEGPLPVVLNSFNSEVKGRNVKLTWITENETNNSGFEIERKSNEDSWTKVGYMPGKGTTNKNNYYIFEDKNLNTGRYKYRLKQIDIYGNYNYFDLKNEIVILPPTKFELGQNYPNPFNPRTKIDFQIPYESRVNLIVYDILGREVKKLISENLKAGYYTIDFNASELSSGIYFYRIVAISGKKEFIDTKKMLVIK
ncbi:MAG: hypothetical protein N2490_04800 [Ignavibacteria bacterium]|nr:hypothetical protein [Ignavibacteria bacterium]